MKIKEVISQTGLTDRAIRLYIENGLVTPENRKSYTGRSSYVFSEEDLKALQQIAVLRKADFSLEQIKAMQKGGTELRETLGQYIAGKQVEVAAGERILTVLQGLPQEQALTLEDVCEKLRAGLSGVSDPGTDAAVSKEERMETRRIRILCAAVLLLGAVQIGLWIYDKTIFPFPKLSRDLGDYIGIPLLLIPLIAAGIILRRFQRPLLNEKKRKRRYLGACVALGLAFFVYLNPFTMFLNLQNPVYSETNNPADYMVLGKGNAARYRDALYKLFPTSIPDSVVDRRLWPEEDVYAETVRYTYRYEHFLDPKFHIFAQWELPEEEYEAEKQRIANYYADTPAQQVTWGEWTCLSFGQEPLEAAGNGQNYFYLLFACNDRTNNVRYIACLDANSPHTDSPFFMTLEWDP